MPRFLIDEQLPKGLAARLVAAGHESKHVLDVGFERASDSAIRDYAILNDFVLVTKDCDFAEMGQAATAELQVVWIRLGNTTNRRLWARIEPLLPEIERRLRGGATLIEVAQ